MTRCKDCEAPLESTDGMWVDARSGDEGGTFDICPARYDAREDGPYGHRAKPSGKRDRVLRETKPDLFDALVTARMKVEGL